MLTDKFTKGRKRVSIGEPIKPISFNKFIKHADKKIDGDPLYDLVADFNHYDVNCDYCLKEHKKIIQMYIMKTDELIRDPQNYDPRALMVKCPNCYQVQKILDVRRLTSAGTIPTIEQQSFSLHVGSATSDRDPSPIELFPSEIRKDYYNLLNLSKNPNMNKKYAKELENYVKDFAGQMKNIKKPFMNDNQALITAGKMITKIEDVNL
jgi:hypothetical protein